MKRRILIDGYNLLYHFPELRRIIERDLEEAREGLLARLSSYAEEKGVEVIVVFDGEGRLGGVAESRGGVKVIFSRPPEKADPLIKRMIDKMEWGMDLTVVSSDNEIRSYARLSRVRLTSSHQFANEIAQKPDKEYEKKFDHSMSPEELEEWMRLFLGKEDPGNGCFETG